MLRLVAVALSVPTVVLTAVTLVSAFPDQSGRPEDSAAIALQAAISITFLATGLFIVARMPSHVVGWILVALALDVSLVFIERWPVPLLSAGAAEVIAGGAWTVGIALVVILMLVFPTGRPISPRWHWAVWSAALWPPLLLAVNFFSPQMMRGGVLGPNANGVAGPLGELLFLVLRVMVLGFAALLIVGGAAAVVRFSRARGDERQQLKWVASAAAALAVIMLITFTPVWGGWLALLDDLSILALPTTIAIAILRHRLYDIDVIIRRTLVYGALTVLLGAVYAGSVVLLTQLLGSFADGNQFAVAVSTIAVVVLFQPLRRHVKTSVDRRFYRSRFDARRIVEALGAQLRNEVDLDSLTEALSGAVTQTMHPTSTSVWLRWRPGGAR